MSDSLKRKELSKNWSDSGANVMIAVVGDFRQFSEKSLAFFLGVAKKHDFRGIQRKIPQVSDFANKWDSKPPPHGGTAADIAKMFAKKFSRKSDFR
jgi:hypothetical protein